LWTDFYFIVIFTDFSLQLCVTVQIPEECGGIQGQAIFIDTEGSFNASRLEGFMFTNLLLYFFII
jgi:hypothetical protein